jgi:hypothetical protein
MSLYFSDKKHDKYTKCLDALPQSLKIFFRCEPHEFPPELLQGFLKTNVQRYSKSSSGKKGKPAETTSRRHRKTKLIIPDTPDNQVLHLRKISPAIPETGTQLPEQD